jgi:hypothetical protein
MFGDEVSREFRRFEHFVFPIHFTGMFAAHHEIFGMDKFEHENFNSEVQFWQRPVDNEMKN